MKLAKIIRITEKAPELTLKQRFDAKPAELNEGPFDFLKGAGAEVGRRAGGAVAGAARTVATGARNVAAAGASASAQADLGKAVAQLAALLAKANGAAPAAAPAQQAPAPAAKTAAQSAVPDAFRSTSKPRGVTGKDGQDFQYTFSSYMQATSGEQIDEGVWDFVKGAGQAVGTGIRDKINAYAEKPSIFKDIYAKGVEASQKGDAKRESEAQAAIKQQIAAAADQVKALAAKLGPQALMAAIKKFGGEQANAISKMVAQQQQAPAV